MKMRTVELSDGSRITELLPESVKDWDTIKLMKKDRPNEIQLGSEKSLRKPVKSAKSK